MTVIAVYIPSHEVRTTRRPGREQFESWLAGADSSIGTFTVQLCSQCMRRALLTRLTELCRVPQYHIQVLQLAETAES